MRCCEVIHATPTFLWSPRYCRHASSNASPSASPSPSFKACRYSDSIASPFAWASLKGLLPLPLDRDSAPMTIVPTDVVFIVEFLDLQLINRGDTFNLVAERFELLS